MKILYLDCNMGAAGDMLTAALFELISDKKKYLDTINGAGLKDVRVSAVPVVKCGIKGTGMSVMIGCVEEGAEHGDHHHDHAHEAHGDHHHDHAHENHDNHHHHTTMNEIRDMVDLLKLPEKIKNDIMNVYMLIARAESRAHGKEVSQIHFHEVGMMDALADIASVCILMDMLDADKVVAGKIHVGSGNVKCAHGIVPVPAPATAYLLEGIPVYSNGLKGELCTPTGAALIKYFVDSFEPMPDMVIRAVGYGMGKKDFEAANCVRATLGESSEETDLVIKLSCNVDDMTGEEIGYAINRLLEEGAKEAFAVPVVMKKSRPGYLLEVLCMESDRDKIIRIIFECTSTIGIRETSCSRYVLNRIIKEYDTSLGKVRVKFSDGYGTKKHKIEYDDIIEIAKRNKISLAEAKRLLAKEIPDLT